MSHMCKYGHEMNPSQDITGCWVGNIAVVIFPSFQDTKTFALQLHKHEYNYSWIVKIRKTSKEVLRSQYSPWPSYPLWPTGIGQYDGLGEYCGPHTAPSR